MTTGQTLIDWDKPVQWGDGTEIETVERSSDTNFLVTGPQPDNWPSGCISSRLGVLVNEHGRIFDWENEPRHVVNVFQPEIPPTIDTEAMEGHPLWATF